MASLFLLYTPFNVLRRGKQSVVDDNDIQERRRRYRCKKKKIVDEAHLAPTNKRTGARMRMALQLKIGIKKKGGGVAQSLAHQVRHIHIWPLLQLWKRNVVPCLKFLHDASEDPSLAISPFRDRQTSRHHRTVLVERHNVAAYWLFLFFWRGHKGQNFSEFGRVSLQGGKRPHRCQASHSCRFWGSCWYSCRVFVCLGWASTTSHSCPQPVCVCQHLKRKVREGPEGGGSLSACLASHSNARFRKREREREVTSLSHLNQGISEQILCRFVESVYHTLIIDYDGSNDQIVDHLYTNMFCMISQRTENYKLPSLKLGIFCLPLALLAK